MDFEKEINTLKSNAKENDLKMENLKAHVSAIESKNAKLVYHIYHVSRATFLRLRGLYNIELLGKTPIQYPEYWMKTFEDGDKDYDIFQRNYLFNEDSKDEENNG